MKKELQDIHKTQYRYFMDSSNKFLDKTAITYSIPIEKGETPIGEVDLNRTYKDVKISRRELRDNINQTADSLWKMGIRKGDIVTLCTTNTPEYLYMIYGLNKIGAIPNHIYPNLTTDELNYFLKEVDSKYILILDTPEIRSNVIEASKDTNLEKIIAVPILESFNPIFKMIAKKKDKGSYEEDDRIIEWNDFIKLGKENKGCSIETEYDANATSALIHTSGTTSVPKAVMQVNKNINAIVKNYDIDEQDWIPNKRYLQVIPHFIAYGAAATHVMLCNNVEVIMIPEYNPLAFPGLVKKYHPHYLTVTPAFWGALIKSKKITDKDLSYFELIGTGGDGFASIEDRVISFLKQKNCNNLISDGYGSTEVSAIACSNLVNHYKKGSLGKPVGNVEIGIFDPDTNEKLDTNEVGEVAITGDTVTKGYYNDEEKTNAVFKKHEDNRIWVHMGDLGKIDDEGFLHYEGRIKNLVIRQTMKISPVLEEKIIESIPGVLECQIVALPDENEGQVPSAHIVLESDNDIENKLSEIIKISNEKIQPFHMPVSFKIRDEIPKTKNNKNNLNALKIEDFATLIPGVLKSNIKVIYNSDYDYELDIDVNPEIANVGETEIEEYIQKFIRDKMIDQKISLCNIKYNINYTYAKYVDSNVVREYKKVKFM